MNPIGAVLSFFTALISPVTEVVKGKQAIKKAVVNAKIEKVKAGTMSDIDMDRESRQLAGYMDDLSFICCWAVVVMAFFPETNPHVMAGFASLELMPMWFQVVMGMMLVRIWGFSRLVTPLMEVIVSKSLIGKKLG